MTWIRFDDGYPWHPKVQQLSDRLFRLATTAVFWCGKHLTDGRIRTDQLTLVVAKSKAADALTLVGRGLWHRAGQSCGSQPCPACPDSPAPSAGTDGWIIHDYFDYQPTREKVIAERAARAQRQRNWMAARKAGRRASGDDTDASADTPVVVPVNVLLVPPPLPTPHPPRREAGAGAPEAPPGGSAPQRAAARGGKDPPRSLSADPLGEEDPQVIAADQARIVAEAEQAEHLLAAETTQRHNGVIAAKTAVAAALTSRKTAP